MINIARRSILIIGAISGLLFSYLVWGCAFEIINPHNTRCGTPLVSAVIILAAFGSPFMTGFLWLFRRWTRELREINAGFRKVANTLFVVIGASILISLWNLPAVLL